MTSRRHFLKACSAGLAAAALPSSSLFAQAAAARCNILFIMADDHAAHAISAYGSKINQTPHIDRLAKEGLLFDHVFATNSICTPSRASILTGQYSHINGVPGFNAIDPSKKTVAGYMRDAGYHTAILGKWHLHSDPRADDWDKWLIYPGQGAYINPVMYDAKGKYTYKGKYATELLTEITRDALDALPPGKPFFVMMNHKAPHRNWVPSKKYRDEFRKKTIPEPPTLFDTWEGRASPIKNTSMTIEHNMNLKFDLKFMDIFGELDWPQEMRPDPADTPQEKETKRRARIRLAYQRYMQDYLACVQSVDDSVGDMLAYLKEKGLDKNTLVIYTSDQGFFLGDHGLYDKRFMMDETIKMPFLARCPALIKTPGAVNSDMITNVDFAPTFLAVAGAPAPSSMQGRSFLPNMEGRTPADWRQSIYYRYYIQGGEHNTPAHYGIRTRDYKLIFYYKVDEWECFDLKKDPEELNNIYADPAYAATVAKLKRELYDLKAKLQDADQFWGATESDPNPPIQ